MKNLADITELNVFTTRCANLYELPKLTSECG